MINLYLGGVDRTAILAAGSLSVSSRLNSRDRASFTLRSLEGQYQALVAGSTGSFTRASVATLDSVNSAVDVARYVSSVLIVERGTTNQLLETDGLLATYTNSNVTQAGTALTNFASSIAFGDNTLTRYAYKTHSYVAAQQVVFSFYCQMDDGSAPVPGLATAGTADFGIVVAGTVVSTASNWTRRLVSGTLYRINIVLTPGTITTNDTGILKSATNSVKGFRVGGFQLELKNHVTSYQDSTATAGVRADDVVTIPTTGWTANDWSFGLLYLRAGVSSAEPYTPEGATGVMWELAIDANNLIRLQLNTSNILQLEIISAGVSYLATTTAAALSASVNSRIGVSGKDGTAKVSVNGTTVATLSYVEPVGLTPASIRLGGSMSGRYLYAWLGPWIGETELNKNTDAVGNTNTTPENFTTLYSLLSGYGMTSVTRQTGLFRPVIGQPVWITDAGTTTTGTAATFTRSTAATIDGTDYAINVIRYQGTGALIEVSVTNRFTNTDGLLATYTSSNVTQAATGFTGFTNAVQFGDNSVQRFAYKTNYSLPSGTLYTQSFYIVMDDGGAPVPGAQTDAGADFSIVSHNGQVSTLTNCVVTLVAGTVYRVSISRTATATSANNGIIKNTFHSARGFKVSGFQLETAGYLSSYAESGATALTRGADTMTFPTTGWTPGAWSFGFTIVKNATLAAVAAMWFIGQTVTPANYIEVRVNTNNTFAIIIANQGGTWQYQLSQTILNGVTNRIALSGDGRTITIALNGVIIQRADYIEPYFATMPTTYRVGGGVNGLYSNVWHNTRTMADDELIAASDGDYSAVTHLWTLDNTLAGTEAQRIFGGSIESMREELLVNQGYHLVFDVDCVSHDALADRRIIARSYESPTQTLSTIVNDIITQDFAGDGIDTTNVATGPAIGKVIFNYSHANTVFDQLAELTGYSWWIDAYKKLYFVDRATITAPYSLTSASANFRSVNVEHLRQDYRNRQYIKAGLGLTSSRTENFVGDGTRKSFTLAYPVGKVPTSITVGGVAKTIGIREVDSGYDWYWQSGSPVINQDSGAVAVGAGVAIAVQYQGQYPILVAAQDDAQVSTRSSVEGGSGYYDEIQDEPDINDTTSASDRANALLRRYARINRKVNLNTVTAGLRAGQLVDVDITQHALTGSWLVESVSVRDYTGRDVEYSATLLDGEAIGGWQGFFGALSNNARKLEFRENEVILLLRTASEQVGLTDSSSYTTAAPTAPLADFAICGFSELTS
jgi:hypothetical protein